MWSLRKLALKLTQTKLLKGWIVRWIVMSQKGEGCVAGRELIDGEK
jgi:hypothetical protein